MMNFYAEKQSLFLCDRIQVNQQKPDTGPMDPLMCIGSGGILHLDLPRGFLAAIRHHKKSSGL